jgi:hypothetical protein
MTTTPTPVRDSVLDALAIGFRVLAKPGFLWAPILLGAVLVLPIAFFPSVLATQPEVMDRQTAEAYLRTFAPSIVATVVTGLIIGPILTAVSYRLAGQHLAGEEPVPFGPAVVGLAWRYFLQGLALALIGLAVALALILVGAVLAAIIGPELAVLLVLAVGIVVAVAVALRLAVAAAFVLEGDGPIQSLRRSWAVTAGQYGRVFRWVFVGGLLVSLASSLISAIVGALFAVVSLDVAGQLLGAAVSAPLSIVSSVVILLLARVVSSPPPARQPAPPVSTDLPAWMGGPSAGPTPGGPPTGGGTPPAPPDRPDPPGGAAA